MLGFVSHARGAVNFVTTGKSGVAERSGRNLTGRQEAGDDLSFPPA